MFLKNVKYIVSAPSKKFWIANDRKEICIVGRSNVGKSTFINKLSKRKAANVGNMPGVTKAQQWIKIKNDFELLDTPGVLWPKFENQEIGTKLALIGTIKQDILDKSNLAYSLLNYLFNEHPEFLTNRYGIELVD